MGIVAGIATAHGFPIPTGAKAFLLSEKVVWGSAIGSTYRSNVHFLLAWER